jgi:hypothetical protein
VSVEFLEEDDLDWGK